VESLHIALRKVITGLETALFGVEESAQAVADDPGLEALVEPIHGALGRSYLTTQPSFRADRGKKVNRRLHNLGHCLALHQVSITISKCCKGLIQRSGESLTCARPGNCFKIHL
jgi:hypothetical protein